MTRLFSSIAWIGLTLTLLVGCRSDQDTPDVAVPIEPATGDITLLTDEFQETSLLVVGSQELNFVVSFANPTEESFEAVQDQLPVILRSEDSTLWDVFGNAVEGPRAGEHLSPTLSLMGFWLTFGSFYPGAELYEGPAADPDASISASTNSDWLVPPNSVLNGGPGKDGIPAVDNPQFEQIRRDNPLAPDALIVGIKIGDDVRAYPHEILDWHEIVNDVLDGDTYISLNYCPLTGTASAWNRELNGEITTFGVSGKLYNTNLIPYDRASDSYWSQMRFDCIHGNRIGEVANTFMVVETTWQTWLTMYPSTQVLTRETGFNRDYDRYPYGSYNEINNTSLIFPLEYNDDRLRLKERVHAVIINGEAKVYPLTVF